MLHIKLLHIKQDIYHSYFVKHVFIIMMLVIIIYKVTGNIHQKNGIGSEDYWSPDIKGVWYSPAWILTIVLFDFFFTLKHLLSILETSSFTSCPLSLYGSVKLQKHFMEGFFFPLEISLTPWCMNYALKSKKSQLSLGQTITVFMNNEISPNLAVVFICSLQELRDNSFYTTHMMHLLGLILELHFW